MTLSTSTSSASPRFLVSATACDAEHASSPAGRCAFQVAWKINPHMRVGAVEPARATWQHRALVGQLTTLGARVDVLPFVHGAYDSVFAKDSAVLAHRRGADYALMARPRYAERRAEQAARRGALEALRFRVTEAPVTPLEGGDVVVRATSHQTSAFMGHGFRSSRASVAALESFLGVPVTPLELSDPTLYHLDMAVAALGDAVLVCEEALTRASMRDLQSAAGADTIIRVSRGDALAFALNFVRVGRHIVLARGARAFERLLESLGYTTHAIPLSEFHLAGGSAACLVARIHALETRVAPVARSTAA